MSENTSGEFLSARERDKKQLGLPFDQYQRYKIVVDALEYLSGESEAPKVLDVGGGEGIILNFLSEDQVTVLDQVEAEGVPGFVVGDATALPFEDESFDYVTSIDVYEHIETGAREKYLTELRRVARKGILLAAPFDSEEVRGVERLANEFHRTVHLQENIWLGEHEQNGLPNLDWTCAYFKRQGDGVSILPNGYLPHWLAMISLFFYAAHLEDESGRLLQQLNFFYNEFMYGYDNSEPSYRHLLIALKGTPEKEEVNLEELASPSDHPSPVMSSTLFATFSAALASVSELKKLNNQLAQKDSLLTQKDSQLKKLNNQLAQKDSLLTQKDILIQNLFERLVQQAVKANTVLGLEQQTEALKAERNQLKQRLDGSRRQLEAIKNSRSWKIIERQRDLRIALRNSFRGRSDKNDG